MKWMKERDLLIAQTMAFVQSVTGKAPDTGNGFVPPAAPPPLTVFAPARRDPVTLADGASAAVHEKPVLPSPPVVTAKAATPVPAQVQPSSLAAPAPVSPPRLDIAAEALAPAPSWSLLPRPDLREDFQSEIRARVASFRAHQERFTREREAYCAATMAKVHAVLKDGESQIPPLT
jgi:hypothetical protein